MPEHAGEKYGMGATMRLGSRTTVFLTKNSLLSLLFYLFNNVNEISPYRFITLIRTNPILAAQIFMVELQGHYDSWPSKFFLKNFFHL